MNMKYLRERKKLRTVDVASRVGVAESTVRNWEYGKTIPKLRVDQIEELLKLYECNFEELMAAVRGSSQQVAS